MLRYPWLPPEQKPLLLGLTLLFLHGTQPPLELGVPGFEITDVWPEGSEALETAKQLEAQGVIDVRTLLSRDEQRLRLLVQVEPWV